MSALAGSRVYAKDPVEGFAQAQVKDVSGGKVSDIGVVRFKCLHRLHVITCKPLWRCNFLSV